MKSRRFLLRGLLVSTVLTAVIGLLHLPAVRSWLAWMGPVCPARSATAPQIAALQELGLSGLRGDIPAPQRLALGLDLDRLTESEAQDWAKARGLDCQPETRGYRGLRCNAFAAEAIGEKELPPIAELNLSFGPSGHLIAVDVYRRGLDAASVDLILATVLGRLRDALGSQGEVMGQPDAAFLQAGGVRTARVRYRYSDYLATVTASFLPWSGLAVRELYQSARPAA